jgi:serine protease Do
MSDGKQPSIIKPVLVSVLLSVLAASVFGFVAGFIAANNQFSGLIMASLPPAVRRILPAATEQKAAGDEGYTLPQLRTALKPQVTEEQATVDVVKKASPAVVSIVISKDVPVWEQVNSNPFGNNDFFNQFFNGMGFSMPQYQQKGTEKQEIGAGTGFIVSSDGTIVTNRHVVSDESAEYTVVMSDDKKYAAKIIGRDTVNDIAILKIEGTGFPTIALGDSDSLQVGQSVIAIGYALGRFGNTVSTGIISGLQRSITAGDGLGSAESLYDVIQTDTAINPGNSGGPLLNTKGEAIGVNVAIVQGSQNIGFALPINDIKKVVSGVAATGKISRPFLGVRYRAIDDAMRKANQLTVDYGVIVIRGQNEGELAVMPGSPADKAGIVENDIILEINGEKITESNPLQYMVTKFSVGDTVKLKVMHKGEEKTVEVTLTERKQ